VTVAGQGQVPVGKLLGKQPHEPSNWRALLEWRDWGLTVKLAAVTIVPILIALVLGVTTIVGQIERADAHERIDALVEVNGQVRSLLGELQRERTLTTELLARGTAGSSDDLDAARAEVDTAIPELAGATTSALQIDDTLAGANRAVTEQLAGLAALREQVAAGQVAPVAALTAYSDVTNALLGLDTAVVSGINDQEIGSAPTSLHTLMAAGEELSAQQALLGYGIARGGLTPSELDQLRATEIRFSDHLADFRAVATEQQRQDLDSTLPGAALDTRDRLVSAALSAQGAPADEGVGQISAQEWSEAVGAVSTGIGEITSRTGAQLSAASAELVDDSSSGAGVLSVLLFAALVLAVAVVFVITTHLLRSLRKLRAGAMDVAENQLPAAVVNIQEGRAQGTDVQPVPVQAGGEIGEVARAFDAVHTQALRLAVEQAAMRTGYGSVFVNLSRRSQSLVQRQLRLIERLERDEEDADQLSTLFQLDHLATRMRRNNENLMVLSGAEPGRRSGQPVTATDVTRAAVSEIEQYQRVIVRPPPPVRVVGFAASDLMRLIAELLDNATAFSAPETQVTMVTRLAEDGSLSIDILDKGIGMNEGEVAEANARLSESGSIDLATSRRMGLFVVGRLASRHGFGVALHGGKDIVGVRATVAVPSALVLDSPGQSPMPMAQPEPPRGPVAGQLPHRRPANGSTRSGVLSDLTGAQQGSAASGHESAIERRLAGVDPQQDAGPSAHTAGPPSEMEVSGTALFSPISRDDAEAAPAQRMASPSSAESETVAEQNHGQAGSAGSDPDGSATPATATTDAAGLPTADADQQERDASERQAQESDEDSAKGEGHSAHAPTGQTGRSDPETAARRADEALPSGKELFEANSRVLSDWWNSATTAADAQRRAKQAARPTRSETTPIFDAMLSAWFRTPEPAESARVTSEASKAASTKAASAKTGADEAASDKAGSGKAAPGKAGSGKNSKSAPAASRPDGEGISARASTWDFATDESWRTVQAVSQSEPSSYTQAGLPRRRRGEQLMPGSAIPVPNPERTEVPAEPDVPTRDPDDVRGRLSSFQQGVHRGRRLSRTDATTQPTAQPERPAQPEQPEQQSTQSRHAQQGPVDDVPLPQRRPGAEQTSPAPNRGGDPAESTGTDQSTGPEESGQSGQLSDWSFAADDRVRAAQSVSGATPSSFTAAGLPRRRRGEQLLPGSAAAKASAPTPRPERDPQNVRGRLSSFQQGIRRGRHHTAQTTDGNHEKVEGE
jgi:signal transduction histidine kinase